MDDIFACYYHKKHVLVTGGAGFIGSQLVKSLLTYGAYVTVIDNLSSGKIQNISSVLDDIIFMEEDIRSVASMNVAAKNKSHIFHCAAMVAVETAEQNPNLCYDINVQGTINVITAGALHAAEHVIFSSSSAVYGNQEARCSESIIAKPISVYGTSKLLAEEACQKLVSHTHISITSLRYFNVYSTNRQAKSAYASVRQAFIESLHNNTPIKIFGSGEQTRDFVPVQSICQANLAAGMEQHLKHIVYNVGTGKSISILHLLKELELDMQQYAQSIEFLPPRPGDIMHSACNKEKLDQLYDRIIQKYQNIKKPTEQSYAI